MTEPEDFTWLDHEIGAITEIAEDDRIAYEPAPGGGFQLKARFKKYGKAEAAARDAAHEAHMLDREAEIAAIRAKGDLVQDHLRRLVAGSAIRDALIAGGCQRKFLRGATLAMLEELPIMLADRDGKLVPVMADGGDIAFAVGSFLSGEGAEFVEPVKKVGAFASAIRSLH